MTAHIVAVNYENGAGKEFQFLDQDAEMLVTLARSSDPAVQAAAIRALGRYESREFTATIAQYLMNGPTSKQAC